MLGKLMAPDIVLSRRLRSSVRLSVAPVLAVFIVIAVLAAPGVDARGSWPTRRELSGEVFAYVEAFYNRNRRHSTLGMLSPTQFEDEYLSLKKEKINSN
jgi:transposase InsO family protein